MSIGDHVQYCESYRGTIRQLGLIPTTAPCPGHHGLPGALIAWDLLSWDPLQPAISCVSTPAPEDSTDVSWVPLDTLTPMS